ncbi:hypothetical protein [Robertmurraya siralis]|uniref:hypothetical protein n=1 Tax=Robertmurraya siralis TaxID=77777 RepID=UPI0010F8EDC4|nr:hypothetical protein [Robertmurraya siralis]
MKEDIQFLKELQQELLTQDYDSQAAPRFWTVGDYKMQGCPEGCQDTYWVGLPNRDYHGDLDDLLDSIKEEIEDDEEFSEEAKRHIQLNHYHYSPKAHTYAMTAWRAPKVERLLKILESFDWDKIEVKE